MKTTSTAALRDLRRRVIRTALSPAERPDANVHHGMAIRILRTRRGETQGELAQRSGVSQTTISRLERDARRIRPEILERLFDALGEK